jgi:hypothetical protein
MLRDELAVFSLFLYGHDTLFIELYGAARWEVWIYVTQIKFPETRVCSVALTLDSASLIIH